jgi:hypothetical protein
MTIHKGATNQLQKMFYMFILHVVKNVACNIQRILYECRFNTKSIERVEYNHIIRAAGEHGFVLSNEFKKFSIEST